MPNKVDAKQREKMIEDILKAHPEYGSDSLKRYYVEQLVESYLSDSDTFNRMATELQKKEKKNKSTPKKKMPSEIIAIYKVGEEPKPPNFDNKFTVNENGKLVVDLT